MAVVLAGVRRILLSDRHVFESTLPTFFPLVAIQKSREPIVASELEELGLVKTEVLSRICNRHYE